MEVLFFLITVVVLASAAAVVIARNPLHSALFLTLHLSGVAALYAMLHAHFLAVAQIVVYSGAIMVLVIFVIMLLNIKTEAPKVGSMYYLYWLTGGLAAASLLVVLIPFINEYFAFFVGADEAPAGTAKAFGKVLFTDYVFVFELSAMLLTAAVIGAVMIGRRKAGDS